MRANNCMYITVDEKTWSHRCIMYIFAPYKVPLREFRSLHLTASVILLMKLFHTLLHSSHAIFPNIQLILSLLDLYVGLFNTVAIAPPSVIPDC